MMGFALAAGICYGIACLMMGVVMLSGLVYCVIVLGVFSLTQWIIGLVLESVTGKRPAWLFSETAFTVEVLLIVALAVGYACVPLHPARMKAETVALVCDTAQTAPDSGQARFSHRENVDNLVEALSGIRVSHVFTTGREVLEQAQNRKAGKYYFYDGSGKLVKRIAVAPGLLGVSNRQDGKFTWYDLDRQDREALERMIRNLDAAESRCRTEDANGEALAALRGSFRYGEGTYWFTVPEFRAEEWNIELSAFERTFTKTVLKSSGYVMRTGDETGTGYFLTEQTENRAWQAGETYSFRLEDRTYEGVYCTVTLDGSEFRLDFPDPAPAYRADRDNPVIYYIC
ncbi:hypothetical protein [Dysosmobacter sp.]|uniref:hypothetical protein n=1 Tax=Dysosmobacter sp. TaxID=2591382 RepID=UPI002A8F3E92|nr:hypothetical protein [Dysosmobacter sp.]MDY3281219.1 hypothetical protein [Dysosmobacter sp.]